MGVLGLLAGWLGDRFQRRPQRKAIALYLAQLPGLLAKDYGARGPYTPAQVERAISRHRIGAGEFSAYSLAIFCDRDDVAETRPEIDYDTLRAEIAEAFFDGDTNFKPTATGATMNFNPNSGFEIVAGSVVGADGGSGGSVL